MDADVTIPPPECWLDYLDDAAAKAEGEKIERLLKSYKDWHEGHQERELHVPL
jgi:hypothetical protein